MLRLIVGTFPTTMQADQWPAKLHCRLVWTKHIYIILGIHTYIYKGEGCEGGHREVIICLSLCQTRGVQTQERTPPEELLLLFYPAIVVPIDDVRDLKCVQKGSFSASSSSIVRVCVCTLSRQKVAAAITRLCRICLLFILWTRTFCPWKYVVQQNTDICITLFPSKFDAKIRLMQISVEPQSYS